MIDCKREDNYDFKYHVFEYCVVIKDTKPAGTKTEEVTLI